MTQFTFPKGFLWGCATSAHQVEGNNTNNDWWAWEQEGRVPEKSGEACRHFELYEKDFDLAKLLGHNAHRFSIEWSRVEPRAGEWDESALSHYRAVLESLRARGIEPIVTLHHFTNPLWLAQKGGWENPQTIQFFERYVRRMTQEFAPLVRYWNTLNEPMVYVYKGYHEGSWPPGEKSIPKAIQVVRHLAHAHVHAYRVIHEESTRKGVEAKVSLAHHTLIFSPCHSHSLPDRFSSWLRYQLFNFSLLDAFQSGWLFFPGIFTERLPAKRSLDYIGVNYYTRDFVEFQGLGIPAIFGRVCTLLHHRRKYPRNQMGWEIYPQGLCQLFHRLKRYRLPILVTENGICVERDEQRDEFIYSHLASLAQAVKEGAPVMGYLYWSLLDNFEWAEGFVPRFGLIEVDYKTQERKVRPSALKMAELIRAGTIE